MVFFFSCIFHVWIYSLCYNQVSSINRILRNLSADVQQASSLPALDIFDNFRMLNHQSIWVDSAEEHTGESVGKIARKTHVYTGGEMLKGDKKQNKNKKKSTMC